MKRESRLIIGIALGVSVWVSISQAGDWPQYRGPHLDGISSETIRTNWTEEPPTVLWRVPMTGGLSSLAISGGRVFSQVKRSIDGSDQEVAVALDADTGEELWATALGTAYYPGGGVGAGDGPRSTPAVKGDHVFILSSYLVLACLDAVDGSVVWSRDLMADFNLSGVIPWQNAASPVLEGDLVILNCHAPDQTLLAVKQEDGTTVWQAHSPKLTHATPIPVTINGVRQVVFSSQGLLLGVVPETGAKLWDYAWSYNGTSLAASPVVAGDIVFSSAAYGTGAAAVRISGTGPEQSAVQLYNKRGQLMTHWSTPSYHTGYLYGIFGQYTHGQGDLQCVKVDATQEEDQVMWTGPRIRTGGVLIAGDVLVVLSESGDLILVELTSEEYREIDRFAAVESACWNAPALSDGRIYARGMGDAVCIDVSAAPAAPLGIASAHINSEGMFELEIHRSDGSAIAESELPNFEFLTAPEATLVLSNWTRLVAEPVLTNGYLKVLDTGDVTGTNRFYQVQENP